LTIFGFSRELEADKFSQRCWKYGIASYHCHRRSAVQSAIYDPMSSLQESIEEWANPDDVVNHVFDTLNIKNGTVNVLLPHVTSIDGKNEMFVKNALPYFIFKSSFSERSDFNEKNHCHKN